MRKEDVRLINAWLALTRAIRELDEMEQTNLEQPWYFSKWAIFIKRKLLAVASREYGEMVWEQQRDKVLDAYQKHNFSDDKVWDNPQDAMSYPRFRKWLENKVISDHRMEIQIQKEIDAISDRKYEQAKERQEEFYLDID